MESWNHELWYRCRRRQVFDSGLAKIKKKRAHNIYPPNIRIYAHGWTCLFSVHTPHTPHTWTECRWPQWLGHMTVMVHKIIKGEITGLTLVRSALGGCAKLSFNRLKNVYSRDRTGYSQQKPETYSDGAGFSSQSLPGPLWRVLYVCVWHVNRQFDWIKARAHTTHTHTHVVESSFSVHQSPNKPNIFLFLSNSGSGYLLFKLCFFLCMFFWLFAVFGVTKIKSRKP